MMREEWEAVFVGREGSGLTDKLWVEIQCLRDYVEESTKTFVREAHKQAIETSSFSRRDVMNHSIGAICRHEGAWKQEPEVWI